MNDGTLDEGDVRVWRAQGNLNALHDLRHRVAGNEHVGRLSARNRDALGRNGRVAEDRGTHATEGWERIFQQNTRGKLAYVLLDALDDGIGRKRIGGQESI